MPAVNTGMTNVAGHFCSDMNIIPGTTGGHVAGASVAYEPPGLSQLRRHAGGKDWECCQPLLFPNWNSIPGGAGRHVAGASAAYENQA